MYRETNEIQYGDFMTKSNSDFIKIGMLLITLFLVYCVEPYSPQNNRDSIQKELLIETPESIHEANSIEDETYTQNDTKL